MDVLWNITILWSPEQILVAMTLTLIEALRKMTNAK